MKLKSSPSGAPSRRMRWASSNSEFRFNSSCPRMAEVLAGESRNTRESGGRQSDESDPGARPPETSFFGAILFGSLRVTCSRLYPELRSYLVSVPVKDKITFKETH